MIKTVIFDGDDTLWANQIYYDEAIKQFVRLAETENLGGDQARVLLDERELANIKIMGYDPARFPLSMTEAYQMLCQQNSVEPRALQTVKRIGESVFSTTPALMPHAVEVLHATKRFGMTTVLFTAGDEQVQRNKIKAIAINDLIDHIRIPGRKDAESFRTLLNDLDLVASETLVVGNSWKSDVVPALTVKLKCVFVPNGGWIYDNNDEMSSTPGVFIADTLHSVIDILTLLAGDSHATPT